MTDAGAVFQCRTRNLKNENTRSGETVRWRQKRHAKSKSKPGQVKHIPLDERVIHRFFLIAKRFDQALVAMHSKKLGISVNNCKIMRVIAFSGPLSATELGARTSLDPDKITRAIDTLVDRSYVIRKE